MTREQIVAELAKRKAASGDAAPVSNRTLRNADNPQAFVGRASTEQLKALLADKRYSSWRSIVQAELAKRGGGGAGPKARRG